MHLYSPLIFTYAHISGIPNYNNIINFYVCLTLQKACHFTHGST